MLRNILVASFLTWAQATTQGEVWRVRREQAPLQGITAVTIKVQDLSGDATRCGITSDAIRSATARPLVDAGLRVLDPRVDKADNVPWVSVQVSVLAPTPGLCIANLNLDLLEEMAGALPHRQTQSEMKVIDAPLTAQLLSDGTFAAGLTADFAQRIQDSVRSLAQTVATKIKRANPSK
jgi:hypothetical protein